MQEITKILHILDPQWVVTHPQRDLQRVQHLGRGMPSHAGHKYFRRVTWDQVRNEKIDGNRGPERNKIKTNSTEQITHAYPFPSERPQGNAPTIHEWSSSPFVYSRGEGKPRPATLLSWLAPALLLY